MLGVGEIISRLLLVTVLAGLLGLEREFKDKPAGFRTNVMVGLGSALTMIVSLMFEIDSARIAAGVITGIGFIGGGLIIHGKSEVHGITTAATIWVVSAIGLAVGAGYFLPAGVVTAIALFVLYFFSDDRMHKIFGV
ncbi:MAG: MgtC/SapB family protein [Patescibacteria group bacterium]|jgi:putative Mg2+ transporter-C (MgtC) family protein|nr:MgtC/SapB family protein [Patescibacteria group bacterium]